LLTRTSATEEGPRYVLC